MNRVLARLRSMLTREPALNSAGRNDPCPCGSGKKYKRCCLDANEQAKLASVSAAASKSPLGGRASAANRALARVNRKRRRSK